MDKYLVLVFALFLTAPAYSQKMFRGIVIDSASFEELPGAIVHVKSTERRSVSSTGGFFNIQAKQNDTLIFTMLGYHSFEVPMFFEEDVLLIRMSEQVILLNEITIRATRLYPNEVINRTQATPKKMNALDGIISPIDYFWKLEREKRKLSRIIEEHNRTQTYSQVVNDPVVKTIMMKAYNITELIYYERIATFNQQRKSISYSTDPEEIMESLHDFFLAATKIN